MLISHRSWRAGALFGLLLQLLLSVRAGAQSAAGLVLRGRVLDAETHQPIPNAQVGVGNNRIGTTTNDDGRFVLAVPAAYAATALDVALLGYQPYRHALAQLAPGEVVVNLRISPAVLGEVTVQGSVTGIIREALDRIPRNYPTRPSQLSGFLRESDMTAAGQYQFVAEATEHVLVPPYTQPDAKGQVRLEHSRKRDVRRGGAARLNWAAGPFAPLRFDFVRTRAEFIRPARFADYAYRIADLTTFQGETVYAIAFAPRPGRRARYAGRLYIGATSFAFFGADITSLSGGASFDAAATTGADSLATATAEIPPGVGRYHRSWKTTYQPYGGKWHLKAVRYRVTVGHENPVLHRADFLTTGIDTAGARGFGYAERAQYQDVFLKNQVAFDSAFWRRYVPPLPAIALQQALADTSAAAAAFAPAPTSKQQRGWAMVRQRLRFSYGAGLVPVQPQAGPVAVGYAPAGSSFAAQGRTAVAGGRAARFFTSVGVQFELLPGLAARYTRLDMRGEYGHGQSGWQAGLGYQYNLRPRRRPLFVCAGLDYTELVLGRDLGTFDNPDRGLRLAGTTLNADRLAAALQTRTTALQPRLGLALELSHRYSFVVDAGYLLPLRTRTEWSLTETSGFFLTRSSAAQPLPAADAQLDVRGAPATAAPWAPGRLLWQAALVMRLR